MISLRKHKRRKTKKELREKNWERDNKKENPRKVETGVILRSLFNRSMQIGIRGYSTDQEDKKERFPQRIQSQK